jgi:hypothetical protein
MKKQYRFLICALLLAGSVHAKTPTCGSSQATDLLARSLAAKLKEMGVNANGLEKQIKINDIQILKRDERLDRYSCQANFSITKPAGISERLYKVFAQPKGADALGKAMEAKYGMQGNILFGTWMGTIAGGIGMIEAMNLDGNPLRSPQDRASALTALKALMDEIGSAYPIPVAYQVFQTQTDGKMRNAINWKTNDDGHLELSVLLFLTDDALR